MYRLSLPTLSILIFVIAGCGQTKPEGTVAAPSSTIKSTDASIAKQETKPSPAAPEEKTVVTIGGMNTGPAALKVTAAEGTAEATFQQTLVAFQDGRLDTLYDLLPASYQTDVENTVHAFGEKMDGELWSKTFGTLAKLAEVLKARKTDFLNVGFVKRMPSYEMLNAHWDQIAAGISDVATSEVADVEGLKRCDVRGLLGSASQLLTGLPLPKFGDMTVTTVHSDATTAVLSYRESKDGEPKEVEFMKVDGKWLPKSLATGWTDTVASIKQGLDGLPDRIASMKPGLLEQLAGVNDVLDKLLQADTPEKFTKAFGPLTFPIAMGVGVVDQTIRDTMNRPSKGNPIRVEINRQLGDDEQTKIKEVIVAGLGDAAVDYEIIANDGKTRFRFSPGTDRDAIVVVLQKHFEGAEVRVNPETKAIQVELK